MNKKLSLISYHTNSWGCGIAKFNMILAKRMSLEFISFEDAKKRNDNKGYLSISIKEFSVQDKINLLNFSSRFQNLTLILHSFSGDAIEIQIISQFKRIIALNAAISKDLSNLGIENNLAFAPSMLDWERKRSQNEFNLFTFGMAHKFELRYIHKLVDNIRSLGLNPVISMSTALHVGEQPSDLLMAEVQELSLEIDTSINFLGFLSDNSLQEKIIESDAVFRFFPDGVRSNSTSLMSALSFGKVTITNLDDYSPNWLVHFINVVDIKQWSRGEIVPENLGKQAESSYVRNCSWDKLISLVKNEVILN